MTIPITEIVLSMSNAPEYPEGTCISIENQEQENIYFYHKYNENKYDINNDIKAILPLYNKLNTNEEEHVFINLLNNCIPEVNTIFVDKSNLTDFYYFNNAISYLEQHEALCKFIILNPYNIKYLKNYIPFQSTNEYINSSNNQKIGYLFSAEVIVNINCPKNKIFFLPEIHYSGVKSFNETHFNLVLVYNYIKSVICITGRNRKIINKNNTQYSNLLTANLDI